MLVWAICISWHWLVSLLNCSAKAITLTLLCLWYWQSHNTVISRKLLGLLICFNGLFTTIDYIGSNFKNYILLTLCFSEIWCVLTAIKVELVPWLDRSMSSCFIQIERQQKLQIRTHLSSLSLTEQSVDKLANFIFHEAEFRKQMSFLRCITKTSGQASPSFILLSVM